MGREDEQWEAREAKLSEGGSERQNQARETNGEVVGGEGWSETEGEGVIMESTHQKLGPEENGCQ